MAGLRGLTGGARNACYDPIVTSEHIRQFARRDWAALAAEKNRRWASAKQTPAGDLLVADQLRHYAIRLHPDWPSAADRAEDLQTHLRVCEALGAVSVRSR